MPMHRPTLHLVDDDDFTRGVVAEMLEPLGYALEEYASAEDFLAAFRPGQPGCLILDLNMPGMSGTELQAELRRLGVSLPIIFLSGVEDVPTTVMAIKGGAEDFLVKPADRDVLVGKVLAALARDQEMRVAEAAREAAKAGLAKLTAREQEVMALALAGKTNKEIARDLSISHRTVETHRARVFLKTGTDNLVELSRIAAEVGNPRPEPGGGDRV